MLSWQNWKEEKKKLTEKLQWENVSCCAIALNKVLSGVYVLYVYQLRPQSYRIGFNPIKVLLRIYMYGNTSIVVVVVCYMQIADSLALL